MQVIIKQDKIMLGIQLFKDFNGNVSESLRGPQNRIL